MLFHQRNNCEKEFDYLPFCQIYGKEVESIELILFIYEHAMIARFASNMSSIPIPNYVLFYLMIVFFFFSEY